MSTLAAYIIARSELLASTLASGNSGDTPLAPTVLGLINLFIIESIVYCKSNFNYV